MSGFPWTKLQDFCLRLGLLKVLVVVLERSRYGISRQQIGRRLSDLLFVPAPDELVARVLDVLGDEPDSVPTLSQALLMTSGSPSWGQPIRSETAYKILEWGQTVGLVGKGYRLTERGHLLHNLLPADPVEAFLNGAWESWNPYTISAEERAFFLYHLGESDHVLWELLVALSALSPGSVISTPEIYDLTLSGMKGLLERTEETVPVSELPSYRTARELAETIEWELSPGESPLRRPRRGPPSPHRPGRSTKSSKRKTKKNADHQTIPRFEQLVDLGFLGKPVEDDSAGEHLERQRKAWKFELREAPQSFTGAIGGREVLDDPTWHWYKLAHGLSAARLGRRGPREATFDERVDLFTDAYEEIHRSVGQTPFESVGITAMARGFAKGLIVEVEEMHRDLLHLKQNGLLQDKIFFASGNRVDQMFILVRADFRDSMKGISERP